MTAPFKPGETVWGFADSADAEGWQYGGATREEAIAAAREHFTEGERIFVVRGQVPVARELISTNVVHWIEDSIADGAGDHGCPDHIDFPDLSKEAVADLERVLGEWADRHLEIPFWVVAGSAEEIPVEEVGGAS